MEEKEGHELLLSPEMVLLEREIEAEFGNKGVATEVGEEKPIEVRQGKKYVPPDTTAMNREQRRKLERVQEGAVARNRAEYKVRLKADLEIMELEYRHVELLLGLHKKRGEYTALVEAVEAQLKVGEAQGKAANNTPPIIFK